MKFGSRKLDLSSPRVMGVLNVTPDSFYDGGKLHDSHGVLKQRVLKVAEKMVSDGADFLDIGGESTRPGAKVVSEQEEMDRVLPIVEAIAQSIDAVISVDTSSPNLMREAACLGAGLINDVRALERPGAIEAVKESGLPVCLMHMQGMPATMQENPSYSDVVAEVNNYLQLRVDTCLQAGIAREQIILDPGFGFGKTDNHNIALLKKLELCGNGEFPLLVGMSRKSMIGRLLGRDLADRMPGSLALAMVALRNGASIIRVHDVAETADVVKIFQLTQ